MIEIKNVSKNYGKKEVIKDLSLKIGDGKIFGFIGPNASGKTTTISMMTGSTNITKGDIYINDISISKDPVTAKKEFGLVPDSPDIFLNMKVKDYFNFIGDIYGIPTEKRKEKILELCEDFEITKYLKDPIETLSHGTKQKVVIVGVLLHEPKVWILDEPMTGLDPNSSFKLKERMKKHAKEGNTVFFSTHVLEVAEKLCDEIAILKDGNILYAGSYDELKKKYPDTEDLEQLFITLMSGGKDE